MELINQLTQQLGINPQQASGGLGLLLGAAKQKLGGDFGQISQHIPGADNLINSAPKVEAAEGGSGVLSGGLGGALSGVTSLLGGKAGGMLGQLGNLGAVAGGFKQLGLDPGMIGKFVPVIMSFVQSKGGGAAKGLLEKALN